MRTDHKKTLKKTDTAMFVMVYRRARKKEREIDVN